MAISVLGSGGGLGTGNISESFTVPAGSNFLIIACERSSTGGTVSACTYNSVAMTPLFSYITMPNSGGRLFVYYLKNPTPGANTIAMSFSDSVVKAYNIIALQNVAEVGTYASDSSDTGTTATTSISDMKQSLGILLGFCASYVNTTATPAGDQTEIVTQKQNFACCSSSTEPKEGTSDTMTWTLGSSSRWIALAIPLYEAAGNPVAVSPYFQV